MKKLMSVVWMCLMGISLLSAQGVEEVTLVVSGDGATKEEATHIALRSAIEQAYGTFVSANTAILNDSLVKDEIVTVSSGNIQNYTELAYMQLENGKSYVSLQATVSLTKLVKYAQSKGAECEFAGATFGANVKLYEFNKANSKTALQNVLTVLRNTDDLFDYVLEMDEPRSASNYRGYSENDFRVGYRISLYANQNTANFYNFMNATLKAISYTKEQIQPFMEMGLRVYSYYTTADIDLQWGKKEYTCFIENRYYIQDIADFNRELERLFNSRIFYKLLLKDNIGNDYPIRKFEYDDWTHSWRYSSFDARVSFDNNGYKYDSYSRSYTFYLHGIFPFNSGVYYNMKNIVGVYYGSFGSFFIIPIDTLSKISSFYLTKNDGSPVPTTTISSEGKLWAGTPPVSLTQAVEDTVSGDTIEKIEDIQEANKLSANNDSDKTSEIDGIPVCTDAEYDLGDIKRGSSASVIFRLAKRDKYTYLYPKISNFTFNGRPAHTDDVGIGGGLFGVISPVTFKKIEDDNYHYVRVTYKPSKGFLASTGPFRAEISINMQKEDGEVDIKTVEIIGNIK